MAVDELVIRLGKLDTCSVSDALDRLEMPGTVHGIHEVWHCPRITGRVVTVKLTKRDAEQSSPRHLGTAAIMAAGPGDIIVIEHGAPEICAGWGGILSLGAKLKGVGGVIVDGACRDVDESREHKFPVYARSAVPTTARGRIVEEDFNIPILVGGVAVNPGDLVIADGSGVVFVGADRAEEVISTAEKIFATEAAMGAALRDGKPITEVMGANYESMLVR
ncbi:MAG TPA: RraA family protein [Dehalococcoidia bacterium]|nr:RraA family protein [Dehalococcoidia bacterium]